MPSIFHYLPALLMASVGLTAARPQGRQGRPEQRRPDRDTPMLFEEKVGGPANAAPAAAAEAIQGHAGGQWGPLIQFPLIPVGAAMIPGAGGRTTQVFTFSSYADFKFGGLGETPMGYTQSAWYDVETGEIRHSTIANTGHGKYCFAPSCVGITADLSPCRYVLVSRTRRVTSTDC